MVKNYIKRDLPKGHNGETQVQRLMESFGLATHQNTEKGKLSDYDVGVHINDTTFTVEVKNDFYAAKSGNIAIETFNPKTNKPSGLNITKADLWCHITDDLYFCPVDKLKEFISKNNPTRIIKAGGDQNADLYLYRADFMISECFQTLSSLDDLTTLLGV